MRVRPGTGRTRSGGTPAFHLRAARAQCAGKSTLLSILINALPPTSGSAEVLGVPSTRLGSKTLAQIGYVAESQELPTWMRGQELLRFLKPLYPGWDDAFVDRLRVTLETPLDRKLANLSRGQQMKVRLLAAMAYRPQLLILDEPFSGLDPLVREELAQGLLELVGESDWTVVLASHDVDELERLADHAGFISGGKLRFSGEMEALQARTHRVEARLQDDRAAFPAEPPQAGWREWHPLGPSVTFIDADFDAEATQATLAKSGPLAHFDHRSLSLREIFVSTSRHERTLARAAV
ncbi:MAG: ATP-binding cassette domain-containing protein [Opitutales bacterium]